jgi:hypothetical protein
MCRRAYVLVPLLGFLLGGTFVVLPGEEPGIPPQIVADYIHALVQADRALYTTHVVERMQELGVTVATEHWKAQRALPLPAQMLLMSGWVVEGEGMGLRIRLTSLWPINKDNGPIDDFERSGLEQVAKTPNRPYTGIITQGEKRYFKALYADRAITAACIDCHNGHELSRKRNHKVNDVMGGIVVSFPLR